MGRTPTAAALLPIFGGVSSLFAGSQGAVYRLLPSAKSRPGSTLAGTPASHVAASPMLPADISYLAFFCEEHINYTPIIS